MTALPPPVPKTNSKSPNVCSLIGFVLSSVVFVFIIIFGFTLLSSLLCSCDSLGSDAEAFLWFVLLFAPSVGTAGLILSIVGLRQTYKDHSPQWIGKCGITFSVLSIVCFMLTMFIGMIQYNLLK